MQAPRIATSWPSHAPGRPDSAWCVFHGGRNADIGGVVGGAVALALTGAPLQPAIAALAFPPALLHHASTSTPWQKESKYSVSHVEVQTTTEPLTIHRVLHHSSRTARLYAEKKHQRLALCSLGLLTLGLYGALFQTQHSLLWPRAADISHCNFEYPWQQPVCRDRRLFMTLLE